MLNVKFDLAGQFTKAKSEICSLKSEWLTTKEAAAYLKVSVGALRNMTSNGKIPYFKLERRNRYRLNDLRDLLLSQRRGGPNGQ
jgi:excisionase family DNA binding protein